ncbi:MAG: OsmC family protein [Sedimentisphaerales bacterium]|nr:OsmC family protein [Sedimentisphaerales bacterium]
MAKYENGFRFSAVCRGYTVTTGRGDDGNDERDGMWPAQLFEASIGMCIGGYVAKFCREQGIPYDDMTVELNRHIKTVPSGAAASETKVSRTARIDAKIRLGAKLSREQQQGILEAADSCHITKSIEDGMQIVCSLADAKADNV